MTNEERIERLRKCATFDTCNPETCDLWYKYDCRSILLKDAADALEADKKRIVEMEKSYAWKAYAALEERIEGYKVRIAELEAQQKKEGEWIEDEYGYIHCSKCGMEWDEPEHPQTNFCPNCGRRMRKGGKRFENDPVMKDIKDGRGLKLIITDGKNGLLHIE